MDRYIFLVQVAIPVCIIVISYIFCIIIERNHLASLRIREQRWIHVPVVVNEKAFLEEGVRHAQMVGAGVVISAGKFGVFIATLCSYFGGRVSVYESLLDRARREAMLRMKENARGAFAIVGVRLITTKIREDAVEACAVGTALYTAHEAAP